MTCMHLEWSVETRVNDSGPDFSSKRTCVECGMVEEDIWLAHGHVITIRVDPLGGYSWACTCREKGNSSSRDLALRHHAVAPQDDPLPPDEGHTFRLTVESRGSYRVAGEEHHLDADWWSDPATVEVRAWDLPAALHKAAELPLDTWFPQDEEEDS